MLLARVSEAGTEIPVVIDAGRVYDLRSLTRHIDPDFFEVGGFALIDSALAAGELPLLDGADIRTLRYQAPLTRPRALVCVGMNYAAHAAESGSMPPTDLVVFFKHPNTIVGPNATIKIPPGSVSTDWEVELAIVIGKRASYLDSPDEALGHIAGYTLSNDVSERDYQLKVSGGQWSKGKCCETFNPMGPWIVRACELDPDAGLVLQSWVNGEPRQHSTTADMIFGVGAIVQQLSQFMVLEPGDVINTGTPEGVALSGRFPYLQEGDVVECAIEGLGAQKQVVA